MNLEICHLPINIDKDIIFKIKCKAIPSSFRLAVSNTFY